MHTKMKPKRNQKFQIAKKRKVLQQSNLITRRPGRNMGQMGHRHDASHPVPPDAEHSCAKLSKMIKTKVQRYGLGMIDAVEQWFMSKIVTIYEFMNPKKHFPKT